MSREEYDEGYANGLADAEELKDANNTLEDTISELRTDLRACQDEIGRQDLIATDRADEIRTILRKPNVAFRS